MANRKRTSPINKVIKDESQEEALGREVAGATDENGVQNFLDNPEFLALLEDSDFQAKLKLACQIALRSHQPFSYETWQDLRQRVLIRFGRWFTRYRNREVKADLARVLTLIARRLIDESRRQGRYGASTEVDLKEVDRQGLSTSSAEDIYQHILFVELRSRLTATERELFDEYLIEGASLKDIAKAGNVSLYTVEKRWGLILEKSREVFEQEPTLSKIEALDLLSTVEAEDKLEQMLLEKGLLSEIPPPITNFASYRKRRPIKVRGKPVSETIIEERR
jgi:DNA-directed RNA polymerase specialized sigma24 family protein